MGYIPTDIQVSEPEELKNFLTPYKENLFIRNLVNGYAAKFPEKVKSFSPFMIQSSH
jgi:DNA polymerase-3 subunit epsilon